MSLFLLILVLFEHLILFDGIALTGKHCTTLTTTLSSSTTRCFATNGRSIDEVAEYNNINQVRQQQDSPDDFESFSPPFFPKDVEELAKDASFSIQLALIGRINRMRVDIRSKLLNKQKYIISWVLLTAQLLINQEFKSIQVFMDSKYDLENCKIILKRINDTIGNTENVFDRIRISYIDGESIHSDSNLFLVFNPDNISNNLSPQAQGTTASLNVLEECQSLCFHAALRSIPVVMINPMLIATSWNDLEPRAPLLLGDFAQVYFICDDYVMLSRTDHWFGIVQRVTTGIELFFLQGLRHHPAGTVQAGPFKYVRVKSWPRAAVDVPDNIRSVITGFMLQDPSFRTVMRKVRLSTRLSEYCHYYWSVICYVSLLVSFAILSIIIAEMYNVLCVYVCRCCPRDPSANHPSAASLACIPRYMT